MILRPLVGPLGPPMVDHSTDTCDRMAGKNVPETNGNISTTGVSYGELVIETPD